MGRQSNRSSSRSAEREFPGCISGVFQNLFDFNQGFPSRKLLQDVTLSEGLEAPRNSLDIPRGTLDFGRKSEANINDIPFGFEFPKQVVKWKVQVEDGPGAGPGPRKLTAEDRQKPSSPRPNVVARLMGLELMPDKAADVSIDRSRRNSLSGDGKQFFGISMDRQHKQEEQRNSKIQSMYRSSSFKEVHPQEKQLEEFKREFVAHRDLQCRDYCQYFEGVAEEQSNGKLKAKRYDQILSKAKYIESTEARPVRQERVEESLNVLQDRNSLQTKHPDTKQGVFHGKSRPPFFDEVAPFRDKKKSKVLPVPLNNNSNGKSSSSVVMPSKTDVKSSSASSEDFRVSRRSPHSEFHPSNNSKENHKVIKSMRFSKEDVFSPKEIARKMVKQAKENKVCRAAKEVFVNHDLAFSPSSSTFRRRNLQKGESTGAGTGAAAVEVESPTLRRLVPSGKSSPRQVISPRLNKSTDEKYRDDGSNSQYGNCSHNNSNSNSPRVQVSSAPSKYKLSNGNKMERERFHGKDITSYDFGNGSQRMFPPFTSHSPINILHGRFPSSNTKKTDYDNYCSISKGKTITKMKTKNSACNIVEVAHKAKLHPDNLAYSAAETTETIPSCTTVVKRPHIYHAEYASPSISSPRSREFVYNKKKIPQPISGEICSMDKTVNKGRQGEVGWGCTSFLDEKRDQPSPVSVLEGNSSSESPSRLDHKDATTYLQELRSRLRLLKENKEEDLTASGNQVMNVGDKVANQNHLNESLTVEDIICPEESKSDLVYVRNILCFAGFKNQSIVTFTKWYSPAHPINPDIFLQLEKYYSEVKPPSPTDNLARNFSNHRKLLFELVDEILCKKVKPLLNIRPWINPRKLNGRNYMISSGKELLKDLWSEICSFPRADCRTLEDVEVLVKGDLGGIDNSAPPTDEDVEKIGFEVEQHIFNTLIEDAVADLFFAL